MKYPRVDVFRCIQYSPIFQEVYQVDTMRPNRPIRSTKSMTKQQVNICTRRELALLKKEGYEKVVYNSVIIDLSKFIR